MRRGAFRNVTVLPLLSVTMGGGAGVGDPKGVRVPPGVGVGVAGRKDGVGVAVGVGPPGVAVGRGPLGHVGTDVGVDVGLGVSPGFRVGAGVGDAGSAGVPVGTGVGVRVGVGGAVQPRTTSSTIPTAANTDKVDLPRDIA